MMMLSRLSFLLLTILMAVALAQDGSVAGDAVSGEEMVEALPVLSVADDCPATLEGN